MKNVKGGIADTGNAFAIQHYISNVWQALFGIIHEQVKQQIRQAAESRIPNLN